MPTLMQRAKQMSDEGLIPEEIATALNISKQWVMMLMSADSFRLVRGEGDGRQGEGEDGGTAYRNEAG